MAKEAVPYVQVGKVTRKERHGFGISIMHMQRVLLQSIFELCLN